MAQYRHMVYNLKVPAMNEDADAAAMADPNAVTQAEIDALLGLEGSQEAKEKKISQPPAIVSDDVRTALVIGFMKNDFSHLKTEELHDAILDLKFTPINEKYISVLGKNDNIRDEYIKVLMSSNISNTNDFFRKKLIEFLESLLK